MLHHHCHRLQNGGHLACLDAAASLVPFGFHISWQSQSGDTNEIMNEWSLTRLHSRLQHLIK